MSAVQTGSGSVIVPQLALFPAFGKRRPAFDVHAISRPARAFTGDFYVTHKHDDRLWFAVGDVSGKGINAAVVMAMIQEELEHRISSCANAGCDPAATMARLHEFLRPLLPANKFASAVIGYASDDGHLVVANAGHPSPIIVRRDGSIDLVDSTGPVVGILPAARWRSSVRLLGRGETLVLYSDGVIEAESPDGCQFGMDGLLRVTRPGNAEAVAEAIIGAVDAHEAGARSDDLTLVVVGRT
jgi:sigma-B regulation protein RsbU (phosphoserine phosphatase)